METCGGWRGCEGLWLPGVGAEGSSSLAEAGQGPQREEQPGESLFVGRIITLFS